MKQVFPDVLLMDENGKIQKVTITSFEKMIIPSSISYILFPLIVDSSGITQYIRFKNNYDFIVQEFESCKVSFQMRIVTNCDEFEVFTLAKSTQEPKNMFELYSILQLISNVRWQNEAFFDGDEYGTAMDLASFSININFIDSERFTYNKEFVADFVNSYRGCIAEDIIMDLRELKLLPTDPDSLKFDAGQMAISQDFKHWVIASDYELDSDPDIDTGWYYVFNLRNSLQLMCSLDDYLNIYGITATFDSKNRCIITTHDDTVTEDDLKEIGDALDAIGNTITDYRFLQYFILGTDIPEELLTILLNLRFLIETAITIDRVFGYLGSNECYSASVVFYHSYKNDRKWFSFTFNRSEFDQYSPLVKFSVVMNAFLDEMG